VRHHEHRWPVIYTCEAGKQKAEESHIDTNHLTTVIWEAGKFEEAARQLEAIIRNTLPDEAQME
jgi:transcriptional regulator with AAA-type ATPase domain